MLLELGHHGLGVAGPVRTVEGVVTLGDGPKTRNSQLSKGEGGKAQCKLCNGQTRLAIVNSDETSFWKGLMNGAKFQKRACVKLSNFPFHSKACVCVPVISYVELDFPLFWSLEVLECDCPEDEVSHDEDADADVAKHKGHDAPEEVLELLPGRLLRSALCMSAG